jgi:hypothetical protein
VKFRSTILLIALAAGGHPRLGAAEEPVAVRAMRLAQEAAAAAEAGDAATQVAKLEAAVALRPDLPQLLLELAQAQSSSGQTSEAMDTLRRLADLGRHAAIEREAAFASLRGQAGFQELVKRFAANLHPRGAGDLAFTLRDVTGLLEGMAWRAKTGEFYFADMHARTVWRRDKTGALQRFTAEDERLLGIFALAFDEAAGALWAATTAVPAMRGFAPEMEGVAALVEIDAESGAVRRVLAGPEGGGAQGAEFRALGVGEDGGVFVLDRAGRRWWRLAPGADRLALAGESAEFFAPLGIALARPGVAVVADEINGLLRVDLASGAVGRLEAPANSTLVDLTGLTVHGDGSLLAPQAGMRPIRVLRVVLDAAAESVERVEVLEAGHLAMSAPATGCLGPGGDYYFIGNAGWARFGRGDGRPSVPRPVPVFRVKIPGSGRR